MAKYSQAPIFGMATLEEEGMSPTIGQLWDRSRLTERYSMEEARCSEPWRRKTGC